MKKTPLYNEHIALKANMVEFAGWHMPLHYPSGIIEEHLSTRKNAGLFDVSHMGRFVFRGEGAFCFLQHALTSNVQALNIGHAQYTIISNPEGGAIDDAYLYRFFKDEYILVVNAANTQKGLDYFKKLIKGFEEVEMLDQTEDLAMLSLQGPMSKNILNNIIDSGFLPEPFKNQLSIVRIKGLKALIGRTGYTGEPLGFELFINNKDALKIWDILIEQKAAPAGLGARDTLRLEAGLPLYGHELGLDTEGKEIPIFSSPLAKFAVSFSHLKGGFIGRSALMRQFEAFKKIKDRDYSLIKDLPRLIMPLALIERGVARAGDRVFSGEKYIGYVTSGTMVPYYKFEGEGLLNRITDTRETRSICLALIDSYLNKGDRVDIEVRGKRIKAMIVPYHLSSSAPPYAKPL